MCPMYDQESMTAFLEITNAKDMAINIVEEKLKLWIFTIMDFYSQYKKSIIMKLYP